MSHGSPPRWDAVVVGAGPAGSASAIVCTRAGLRVLIVDRRPLPRGKVCGCCLDPAAVAALTRLGAREELEGGWVALRRIRIHAGRRPVELPLGGAVVSRERLDSVLAARARAAGATAMWPAKVRVSPPPENGALRRLEIHREPADAGAANSNTDVLSVEARLVVAACGLGGMRQLGLPVDRSRVVARVGLGAVAGPDADGPEPGAVRMGVGRDGYVGMVRLEDGRLDVAASVAAAALSGRTPADVVDGILVQAGLDPLPTGLDWRGTPTLRGTAREGIAGVVAVGDAAGFWEPFTGEGIGWALEGGERLAALARRMRGGDGCPSTARFQAATTRWLRRRQARSRVVGWLAGSPLRVACALAVARSAPWLGRLIAERPPAWRLGESA